MSRSRPARLRRLVRPSGGSRPLVWIAAACLAVELAILAATALTAGLDVRYWTVARLGFWPGLLDGWQAQTVWMFLTYWLVHTGPVHLVGNLAALLWIAQAISPRLWPVDVCNIWLASVIGGGVAFGLIGNDSASVVGASGGIFGLIGALIVLGYRYTDRTPAKLRRAGRRAALVGIALVALSVADLLVRGPVMAWEAHLGGLLAGALIAALGPYREPSPRPRPS